MAERTSFIDEGFDRVQAAWTSVGDEFESFQKSLEKRRKEFEKETRKQVKKLRKTEFVKRAETLRRDAAKQFDSNVESLLGVLPLASRAQLKRLERRVSQLSRKVNTLEKEVASRTQPAAAAPAPAPTKIAPEPRVAEEPKSEARGNGRVAAPPAA